MGEPAFVFDSFKSRPHRFCDTLLKDANNGLPVKKPYNQRKFVFLNKFKAMS
jgi:hypothetical protein